MDEKKLQYVCAKCNADVTDVKYCPVCGGTEWKLKPEGQKKGKLP